MTVVVGDGWYDDEEFDVEPDDAMTWMELDRLRDEWLWAQADAYYDYMQEDGLE